MPVDRVAEQQTMLDIANREGSLNNEQLMRSKLEAFQNRFREQHPSVVEVSTDAEKMFREDLETLNALASLTVDREIKRLCIVTLRCLAFLARRQGGN